jgi:hypothetical protein
VNRRGFLLGAGAAAVAAPAGNPPVFQAKDPAWQQAYDRALAVLDANVQVLPRFDAPLLIEGAEYPGVWQECGPQEALVYLPWRPDVAANNHRVFFALQRPDGQLPANNKRSEAGFGQIQMVVPIAATAWEVAQRSGDAALLDAAYTACGRWDDWLVRFRNTRGTGLVEGFCTYDTGHDNSPRWRGVANQCPGKDAKRFVPGQGVPRLCPDLSATVYGGRVALAKMAQALGRRSEADAWVEKAEALRQRIVERLYVPEDHAFYDLDAAGNFVKVRGDVLSRVCGEHVVDQALFDQLWTAQIHNPAAFWPAYPLPSIALDDPSFVRPIPRNSWGGASQALTALRAGRWMEHYNRPAEFSQMMQQWCAALIRDGVFRQQMDPVTGVFTEGGSKGYSPAALVLLDYTWRLAGVRVLEDGTVEWNVRPGGGAAGSFRVGKYELRYRPGFAEMRIHGRLVEKVTGTARWLTSAEGTPIAVVGIMDTEQPVAWGKSKRSVKPNQRQAWG